MGLSFMENYSEEVRDLQYGSVSNLVQLFNWKFYLWVYSLEGASRTKEP